MATQTKAATRTLKLHPLAACVPEMCSEDYPAFAADVKERGIKVPLEVLPGTSTVIDGRTRLQAAKEAGLAEVPVVEAKLGSDTPVAYMLRAAITRRHLTQSQRNALGAELKDELAPLAKERQREGGKKGGQSSGRTRRGETPKARASSPKPSPKPPASRPRDEAAAIVGGSARGVQDAATIKAKAPDLHAKVKAGKLTISQAKVEIKRKEKRNEMKAKAKAAPPATAGQWEIIEGDARAHLGITEQPRLIFADPPYNIGIDYGKGSAADSLTDEAYLQFCSEWVAMCHARLAPDGSLWVLINTKYAGDYAILLKDHEFTIRNWITWYETFGVNCADKFNRTHRHLFYCVKDPKHFVFNPEAVTRPSDRQAKYGDNRAAAGGKLWDDVWGINPPIPRLVGTAAERIPDFPTQLPLALLRPIIGCASDPGDLVLDPFSGSATTGAVALELGRRYIGIEKSAVFADLSRQRLQGIAHATR